MDYKVIFINGQREIVRNVVRFRHACDQTILVDSDEAEHKFDDIAIHVIEHVEWTEQSATFDGKSAWYVLDQLLELAKELDGKDFTPHIIQCYTTGEGWQGVMYWQSAGDNVTVKPREIYPLDTALNFLRSDLGRYVTRARQIHGKDKVEPAMRAVEVAMDLLFPENPDCAKNLESAISSYRQAISMIDLVTFEK